MTIAELIQAHGLTQSGLSRETGIPLRTIQNWCGGQRQPAPWLVDLIAFFLENHK